MKYIDAEQIRAEIERLKECSVSAKMEWIDEGYNQNAFAEDCRIASFDKLLAFLDTLPEQPEVDLEKELDQWRHEHFAGERDGHYSGEYLKRSSQLDIARHFYELGLNARKED